MFESFWSNVDACTTLKNRQISQNKKLGISDHALRHQLELKIVKDEKNVIF